MGPWARAQGPGGRGSGRLTLLGGRRPTGHGASAGAEPPQYNYLLYKSSRGESICRRKHKNTLYVQQEPSARSFDLVVQLHVKRKCSLQQQLGYGLSFTGGAPPQTPHSRSASGLQVMLVGRSRGLRDYRGNSIIN